MSVDTTVPNSSNNVGNDLSALQSNFDALASAEVVDEGSTSDGDYIRYDNGWQICTIEKTMDFNSTSNNAYLVEGTDSRDIEYPVSFLDVVSVSFSFNRNIGFLWSSSQIENVAGNLVIANINEDLFYLVGANNRIDEQKSMYFAAIGRWK